MKVIICSIRIYGNVVLFQLNPSNIFLNLKLICNTIKLIYTIVYRFTMVLEVLYYSHLHRNTPHLAFGEECIQ